MMFLQTSHGADVVHLDVVGQTPQTLPPHLHLHHVLADHVSGPDVDHVKTTADDEGFVQVVVSMFLDEGTLQLLILGMFSRSDIIHLNSIISFSQYS